MQQVDAASYRPRMSTTPTRNRERATYDKASVHAILDEALVCHLGFVADGELTVLPTLQARDGQKLYLHGSTGSRPLRLAADGGLPVCATVTLLDGLVLARSAFHHSVNYRSVVVRGIARALHDDTAKQHALDMVLDKVAKGRSADCRPPTVKELASTAVLTLDLDEVSAKVRDGGVADDAEDMSLPYWAGVVPLRLVAGEPRPDAQLTAGVSLPPYLTPAPARHTRTPARVSDGSRQS